MAFFGKSEDELKKLQDDLDTRETSLNEYSRKLKLKKNDLTNQEQLLSSKQETLLEKDADIGKREQDIIKRELEAKKLFVTQQRQAFKEAIETQLNLLDERAIELDKKQEDIEKQFVVLKRLEGDIAIRERTIKEDELKSDNGFAEKNQIALREIDKRLGYCESFEDKLKIRESDIEIKIQSTEERSEQLRKRELKLKHDEIKRDEGFIVEKQKLDDDLLGKTTELLKEIDKKRENEINKLEKYIVAESERRLNELEIQLNKKLEEHKNNIQGDISDLDKEKNRLLKKEVELEALKDELTFQKQRLESRKDLFDVREQKINLEVESKVEERKKSFSNEVLTLQDENLRLRDNIKTSSELISNYEELKHKLGDEEPANVLLKLKTYEEENRNLLKDLSSRPTQEMQLAFGRINSEKEDLELNIEKLSEENNALLRNSRKKDEIEMLLLEEKDLNKSLTMRYKAIDADNNRLLDDLRRLQASYEREQDREARIKDIEAPYIQKDQPRAVEKVDELIWLDGISNACDNYGLKFQRRILHAFHTALKTSEWSPITILSGVSGTGKSELPRLYSHFGGINFLSLSVQPNWDSQESMLGFFNSIDNKFDAQPVLRFLAQSQKMQTEEYPYGLKDVMSLILMDEMNLAHVELYFAEFLSKLELRRGRKGSEVPDLEVKLGAGIPHYELPLGRNILWAGTMNQDETTKSLSDKVLDRGILINFPRPTILERRKQLKALGEPSPLLSRKVWQSWWCKESTFSDAHILPYKSFVEELNDSLSKVGRALGHRVWQSIEYYMSNYPDVMEAQRINDDSMLSKSMKIAFEDQLVQKVMPKLRGIETRGTSKSECLDKIRSQLVNDDYSIVQDFDLACEFGYGQFIWNSANYLKEDLFEEPELEPESNSNSESVSESEPVKDNTSANPTEASDHDIPNQIIEFANSVNKNVWAITLREIMLIMKCDPKEANIYRDLVKKSKDL